MKRLAFVLPLAAILLAAEDHPAFEAASIRSNPAKDGSFSSNITESGRLTMRNMSAWNLMREAYGWRDNQIVGGPAWLKEDGFDVEAVPPQASTAVDRKLSLRMLQTLLEDRFHLRWHEEMREMAAYGLRVDTGGSRLQPGKDGPARMQKGNLAAPNMTIESLCQILEFELRRPVVNQTGLNDTYSIELQWARDPGPAAQEPDTTKPSLFTAVKEQLGLRLDSAKLPVKVFVIDDIARPSEN